MNNEINRIYDDEGNKIDLHSIPVPPLCIICESYDADNWEENLLCNLNRFDQKNSKEFICDAFQKK